MHLCCQRTRIAVDEPWVVGRSSSGQSASRLALFCSRFREFRDSLLCSRGKPYSTHYLHVGNFGLLLPMRYTVQYFQHPSMLDEKILRKKKPSCPCMKQNYTKGFQQRCMEWKLQSKKSTITRCR